MQGYKDAKDIGYRIHERIHRIEDTGYSKFLAAWWPLYRGAGGYIYIYIYMDECVTGSIYAIQ